MLGVEALAAYALELLGEVHCDLADVPKAQALVAMFERIKSGEYIIVTPAPNAPVASANPVPPGALHG